MAGKNSEEQFSEKEEERFEAALHGGLNTPHTPVARRAQ